MSLLSSFINNAKVNGGLISGAQAYVDASAVILGALQNNPWSWNLSGLGITGIDSTLLQAIINFGYAYAQNRYLELGNNAMDATAVANVINYCSGSGNFSNSGDYLGIGGTNATYDPQQFQIADITTLTIASPQDTDIVTTSSAWNSATGVFVNFSSSSNLADSYLSGQGMNGMPAFLIGIGDSPSDNDICAQIVTLFESAAVASANMTLTASGNVLTSTVSYSSLYNGGGWLDISYTQPLGTSVTIANLQLGQPRVETAQMQSYFQYGVSINWNPTPNP